MVISSNNTLVTETPPFHLGTDDGKDEDYTPDSGNSAAVPSNSSDNADKKDNPRKNPIPPRKISKQKSKTIKRLFRDHHKEFFVTKTPQIKTTQESPRKIPQRKQK